MYTYWVSRWTSWPQSCYICIYQHGVCLNTEIIVKRGCRFLVFYVACLTTDQVSLSHSLVMDTFVRSNCQVNTLFEHIPCFFIHAIRRVADILIMFCLVYNTGLHFSVFMDANDWQIHIMFTCILLNINLKTHSPCYINIIFPHNVM